MAVTSEENGPLLAVGTNITSKGLLCYELLLGFKTIVAQLHQTMEFIPCVKIWITSCYALGHPYNYTGDRSHGVM